MKEILKLKSWILFIAGFGIIILIIPFSPGSRLNDSANFIQIATKIAFIVQITWLYSIATYVGRLNAEKIKSPRIPISLLTILCVIGYFAFSSDYIFRNERPIFVLITFISAILCAFTYIKLIGFCAKQLRYLELNRDLNFHDYFSYAFLLWIFPIGVWIIQPKINSIVYQHDEK